MSHATQAAPAGGFASIDVLPEVTASVLKNKFSEVVRMALREPLAITRHSRREFVILTAEQYEELQQSQLGSLAALTAEFDEMVAKMNTPADRAARRSFFKASAVKAGPALARLKKGRAHAG
jgi:prevent-host-death family protein